MTRKPQATMTWYRIVTREGAHCARVGDLDPQRAFIQARMSLAAVYRNHRIAPETFDTDPPFEIVAGQHVQWSVIAFYQDDDKGRSYGPYSTQAAASVQFHRARNSGARRVALYRDNQRVVRWTPETEIAEIAA